MSGRAPDPCRRPVTEIPEHLLRRSRERREALGWAPGAATPPAAGAAAAARRRPREPAPPRPRRSATRPPAVRSRAPAPAARPPRSRPSAPRAHPGLGDARCSAFSRSGRSSTSAPSTPADKARLGPLCSAARIFPGTAPAATAPPARAAGRPQLADGRGDEDVPQRGRPRSRGCKTGSAEQGKSARPTATPTGAGGAAQGQATRRMPALRRHPVRRSDQAPSCRTSADVKLVPAEPVARRARGRRGPGGRGHRLLAGRGRPRRRAWSRRSSSPREKTCGDGLTPRAVKQLEDMGLGDRLHEFHRFDGPAGDRLRPHARARVARHPGFPSYGYVVQPPRPRPDGRASEPVKAGATVWHGGEAVAPVLDDGLVRGAVVKDKGTTGTRRGAGPLRRGRRRRRLALRAGARHTTRPLVPAGHGDPRLLREPRHAEPWIESHLDVRDAQRQRAARATAGSSRWATARMNVGIGLLSTFRDWKAVNTSQADGRVRGDRTRVTGASRPRRRAVRPPAGGCRWACRWARTSARRGWWSATPPARSTRSTARASTTRTRPVASPPSCCDEALATGDGMALQRYEHAARGRVRPLLQGGAAFAKMIGRPALMRELVGTSACSRAR